MDMFIYLQYVHRGLLLYLKLPTAVQQDLTVAL
jgi:hypothetical protein